jgi:hypothetical protein
MDELTQKLEELIKREIDSTAGVVEGERGVIGLEVDGVTYFVQVQEA